MCRPDLIQYHQHLCILSGCSSNFVYELIEDEEEQKRDCAYNSRPRSCWIVSDIPHEVVATVIVGYLFFWPFGQSIFSFHFLFQTNYFGLSMVVLLLCLFRNWWSLIYQFKLEIVSLWPRLMDSKSGTETPQESGVESFFNSAPPLKDRDQISQKLEDFITKISISSGKWSCSYHIYLRYDKKLLFLWCSCFLFGSWVCVKLEFSKFWGFSFSFGIFQKVGNLLGLFVWLLGEQLFLWSSDVSVTLIISVRVTGELHLQSMVDFFCLIVYVFWAFLGKLCIWTVITL